MKCLTRSEAILSPLPTSAKTSWVKFLQGTFVKIFLCFFIFYACSSASRVFFWSSVFTLYAVYVCEYTWTRQWKYKWDAEKSSCISRRGSTQVVRWSAQGLQEKQLGHPQCMTRLSSCFAQHCWNEWGETDVASNHNQVLYFTAVSCCFLYKAAFFPQRDNLCGFTTLLGDRLYYSWGSI